MADSLSLPRRRTCIESERHLRLVARKNKLLVAPFSYTLCSRILRHFILIVVLFKYGPLADGHCVPMCSRYSSIERVAGALSSGRQSRIVTWPKDWRSDLCTFRALLCVNVLLARSIELKYWTNIVNCVNMKMRASALSSALIWSIGGCLLHRRRSIRRLLTEPHILFNKVGFLSFGPPPPPSPIHCYHGFIESFVGYFIDATMTMRAKGVPPEGS